MKKGVTLISIIIYLVLFTTFVAFAVSISSNINRNVLTRKGSSAVELEYSKIYTNMFSSAKSSDYFTANGSNVVFSNGDVYSFDKESGLVTKNGGVIAENLVNYTRLSAKDITGTSLNENALASSEVLVINVELKKYSANLNRNIIIALGDGLDE